VESLRKALAEYKEEKQLIEQYAGQNAPEELALQLEDFVIS
jgi:hypothetical protein